MTRNEIIAEILEELQLAKPREPGDYHNVSDYREGYDEGKYEMFDELKGLIENMLDAPC